MEPIIDSSKALLQAYFTRNAEFMAMLDKRTSGEIAYDSEVVAGLKNGLSIEQALKAAGEKNPEEALKGDKGTIESIGDHYKFWRAWLGNPAGTSPAPAGAGRNSRNAAGDDFARLI